MTAFPFRTFSRLVLTLVAGLIHVAVISSCSEDSPRSAQSASVVPDERADSLRLTLTLRDTVTAGEPVPVTLRAENVTDRRLDLYLTGREVTMDLVVTNTAGDTIWRRLEGEVVPMVLRVESLEPNASLELTATWPGRDQGDRPVVPGLYRVRGSILAEGGAITSAPRDLRIRAR
jgi:hypothetical protein